MQTLELEITTMAHGGSAMGRDEHGKAIFVPFAVPGESVRAKLVVEKRSYAQAEIVEVLKPSAERTEARCPHFTVCGGCHYQHLVYQAQLNAKEEILRDQLKRIGGIVDAAVRPTIPNASPWFNRMEVVLSPTEEGDMGFWSPRERRVVPIDECYTIHPVLLQLWQDFDLNLPDLHKLTLRIGDDEALMAILQMRGAEVPDLQVDFPVSVAIMLPDGSAATLIGDHYLVQSVKERDFRVSSSSHFHLDPAAVAHVVDAVLECASLTGEESVVELYSGVGVLTAFLAESSASVWGIEMSGDAIEDAVVNLQDHDNVTLFQGSVEEVFPKLGNRPDVVVANPSRSGLSTEVINAILDASPDRFIYVSSDAASLARDGRHLERGGFHLVEVLPIDAAPQNYQINSVSLWQPDKT